MRFMAGSLNILLAVGNKSTFSTKLEIFHFYYTYCTFCAMEMAMGMKII